MKIYTKAGDKGKTSLFGGKKLSKADLRVEAYGTVDELNSLIGVIVSLTQSSKFKAQNYNLKLKNELIEIQKDLFQIGSILANPNFKEPDIYQCSVFIQKRVDTFEKVIDEMTSELPNLHNFILPGGGEIGSLLHFARSVARRCERKVVILSEKEEVLPEILIYFNRLSDFLFTMARYANYSENKKEIIWDKDKK